jgi:hypothetical protein
MDELTMELAAGIIPGASLKVAVTCQMPGWKPTDVSVAGGQEVTLFDIKVCGIFSVGTVTGVAEVSGSLDKGLAAELALKLNVPFLPRVKFTVLKLPNDFQ